MYLRQIYIENNGPLRKLDFECSFSADGLPKPLVLVGSNGSGKTNLLSIIADSLFEAAASHYTDALPASSGTSRQWFRLVGPITATLGTPGSCAILEFTHDEKSHLFREKSGTLKAQDLLNRLPATMKAAAVWPDDDGPVKDFSIDEDVARKVFALGVYLYYPASRSEVPHWINGESIPTDNFDLSVRFRKKLGKPIYVERGLDQLKQWILTVLIDSRIDFSAVSESGVTINPETIPYAVSQQSIWKALNAILRVVLDDQTARFVWFGRRGMGGVGFARGPSAPGLPLNALSSGQATLLNIFGTIFRYGDGTQGIATLPSEITGICVIDEIDAHMHVDLQHRALPDLLRMFPKVQFIVSCHSPFFVLGMEKALGNDGVSVVEMPAGTPIQAEAYAEFGRALKVLRDTKTFNQAVIDATSDVVSQKLLVMLEGETDPIYLTAAAELLGRKDLLDAVDLQWIGAKDPKTREGFNTGKNSLNAMASLLRSKPDLVKRPVLLLYDNDAKKAKEDFGRMHVRSTASNSLNELVLEGVENLLPTSVFTEDMFDKKETKKSAGGTNVSTTLNKMRLCRHLCENSRTPSDFAGFGVVLDLIKELSDVYKK